ncbi:uncharacterized protein [Littorina saxatilis]|uniref:uncharacterized protein n=1 Tax=Littorina saxatilis TaxID=31220 RepID=UPI0038B554D2
MRPWTEFVYLNEKHDNTRQVSAGGFGQVNEEAYASEGSWLDQTREKKRLHMRKKRKQLKQNPQLLHLYRQRQREYDRRYRDKQRQRRVSEVEAVYKQMFQPWTFDRSQPSRGSYLSSGWNASTHCLNQRPARPIFDARMSDCRGVLHPRMSAEVFGVGEKPEDWETMSLRQRKVVTTRLWREKMKQNPLQYQAYRQKQRQYVNKYRAKRRSQLHGFENART